MGNRGWIPRWRFQPGGNLDDAFRLLDKAAPNGYTMLCDATGMFGVTVEIAGAKGKAQHRSKPQAITLAVARALGLEV